MSCLEFQETQQLTGAELNYLLHPCRNAGEHFAFHLSQKLSDFENMSHHFRRIHGEKGTRRIFFTEDKYNQNLASTVNRLFQEKFQQITSIILTFSTMFFRWNIGKKQSNSCCIWLFILSEIFTHPIFWASKTYYRLYVMWLSFKHEN